MAGEDLPVMPVDHPLSFFGPYEEFAGTGKDIGYPLLRDQGNSAYMRDTGDPTTPEGGQIEWGYYEEKEPRLLHPRDLPEKGETHWSPSQRDLELDQIMEPLERAMELTPILGELGFKDDHSFNGLLQVTSDGGPSIGESVKTRGLWYAVAVWVKDAPGIAKVLVDWMTDGVAEMDFFGIDTARHYPIQKTPSYIHDRCYESAFKIYNPAVHNREPYTKGRNLRRSPFWAREQELGGYFMELAGWERAHGYASNEHLLEKYADQGAGARTRVGQPPLLACVQRRTTGDVGQRRHDQPVAFRRLRRDGPGRRDADGIRQRRQGRRRHADRQGRLHPLPRQARRRARRPHRDSPRRGPLPRDRRRRRRPPRLHVAEAHGRRKRLEGLHRRSLRSGFLPRRVGTERAQDDPGHRRRPGRLGRRKLPVCGEPQLTLQGIPVEAFRISYVGEQGWELHVDYSYGLSLWDLVYAQGATPVGVETYANSRRMEKSLRLQNADLLTEYNLYEAGLSRPVVKQADFHGKAPYLEQRELEHQAAYLCTFVMDDNTDSNGIARYPVGNLPLIDPATGEVPIDSKGRRSYLSSIAFGPTVGKNIGLGYLPHDLCEEGREFHTDYLGEQFTLRLAAVGYKPLYDPENKLPKS